MLANLAAEQIQTGMVDAIDATVIRQLRLDHTAGELAGGDRKARVTPGSPLRKTTCLEQHYFLLGV